jgi:hypothetical protein
MEQDRTYASELQMVEMHTLSNLDGHLVAFLRDHENLQRCAIRSRTLSNRARDATVHMHVFDRVIVHVRNFHVVYGFKFFCESRSFEERSRMQRDPASSGSSSMLLIYLWESWCAF